MKYTAKYFKDTMPEWKRKKDPPLSRIFYRPAGYFLAAVFANIGISANSVSYLSILEGILACILFLPNNFICRVMGAVLVNLWLVLDCTDGCIARSVKAQPFGEFADGISSYTIVALLGICMGMACYSDGGLLINPGSPWIIFIGSVASVSDTLMRLVYQKYKAVELDLASKGLAEVEYDLRQDHKQVGSLRIKIEQDLGIGGILPLLSLLGVLFHSLDLVLFYCLLYYGGSCIVVIMGYIHKARKAEKFASID